jgi:benzodiazapine receptor
VGAAGAERRLVAIFFGARRTGIGAVVIGALLPAVAATAATSARVDRRAGLLYAPYLAWSTYAAALNLEIWRHNRS